MHVSLGQTERRAEHARERRQIRLAGLLTLVFGDDDVAVVPIDHRAHFGDVAIVQAIGANPLAAHPRAELALRLLHPIGQHLRVTRDGGVIERAAQLAAPGPLTAAILRLRVE